MLEGRWEIWQQPTGELPMRRAVIAITITDTGASVPEWFESAAGLTFVWPDGRRKVYPWAHVIRAEYSPPLREDD